MTLEELFLQINVDEKTKNFLEDLIIRLKIDPDLIFFIYQQLNLKNIPAKLSYVENLAENLSKKGFCNKDVALYYFNEKNKNKGKPASFSLVKSKLEKEFNRELSKTEENKLKRIRFEYNISYPLLIYAIDTAVAGNHLSVSYIEGVVKRLKKNNINNMDDLIEFFAIGKKLKK
ncbi:DnaD domain protein [Peptoniphilus harei]|uniref:DnaD domain protein n=1 Tax=Peptoniphilus harei TaxID=54005 RepID=A0A943SNX3_9FIRM|nr:DnaD domain protein [Peptoniphilus harei]MBS6535375.1 DnaD domain protein [Peptoniphilus harei]